MVGEQNKFSGNILLYDYLAARRAPIFLNRNLNRALRIHQHLLTGDINSLSDDYHNLRQVWQHKDSFLSWDKLDEMMQRCALGSYFVLDVHSIKPFGLDGSHSAEAPAPAKKARQSHHVKSTVRVFLNKPCKDPFGKPINHEQNARLIADHGRTLKVETDPLIIPATTLTKDIDLDTCDYKLQLFIQLESAEDAEDLYSHLGIDQDERLLKIWGASWTNILQCGEGREVLELDTTDGHSPNEIGLEVSMYWTDQRSGSILASHNEGLRAEISAPKSWRPAQPNVKYKVTYTYGSGKTVERAYLLCPQEQCQFSRSASADLEALRLHLELQHENLKYRLVDHGMDDDGPFADFTCEIAAHQPYQRASANAPEPLDICQVPSEQLFNRGEFLETGSDGLIRQSRVGKRWKGVKSKKIAANYKPAPVRRKLPEEVKDIPVRVKPKFPVPEAPPGVTFVRSISRRALETGETISESDDDPDESWIAPRKAAEYANDLGLSKNTRRFLTIYDPFIRTQRINGDRHLNEAQIRFVRTKATTLWRAGLHDTYRSKVDQLFADEIIDEDTHVSCVKIFEERKPMERGEKIVSNTPKHKDKRKGKARCVVNTGQITPSTADSDGDVDMRRTSPRSDDRFSSDDSESEEPPYGLCMCGKDAHGHDYDTEATLVFCNSLVSVYCEKARSSR